MGVSKPGARIIAAAFILGMIVGGLPAAASAKDKDDTENRLRAALRQTTAQLRDLEDQNATLQAKQAESDRDRQTLNDKVTELQKQIDDLQQHSKVDKAALQKSEAKNQDTEANRAKWEAAYKEAADVARSRDADAKRLDAEAKLRDAALVKTRDLKHACEDKNAELYKLGEQLLDLYDQKGVFEALAAKELVTQLKRVEYQNIMQDYEDKLRANEVVPPSTQQ